MRAIILTALLLCSCAHGAMQSLVSNKLSADLDHCSSVLAPGPSQLEAALAPFQAEIDAGKTGTMVLEEGASALISRAWLADNATKSIDVQYFIFAADGTGLIATEHLLRAAERGVKVRLLVDDTLAHGDENIMLALSAHPNAEVRIYNPNIKIGKTFRAQAASALSDFRGVNQRMHNKTFIVDGKVSITGGRNVADEYFDFDETYNYRDRDVLLIGGASSQIQTSFDQFWDSRWTAPLEELLPDGLPVPVETIWSKLHNLACDPALFLPEIRERIQQVPQSFLQRASDGELFWVEDVHFVSDLPRKNATDDLVGGGRSTQALLELVRNAKEEVLIQTPYLVVTEVGLGLFSEAAARGVEVSILTNSLAVTDSIPAYGGYRKVRDRLLAAGVKLYEFRPDAEVRARVMTGPEDRKDAPLGIHAKSMVVDGRFAVIGTFNLDPRSANLNTECIAIIDSEPLAGKMAQEFKTEMSPSNAWQRTEENNPDREASLWLRLSAVLAGIVPKKLL